MANKILTGTMRDIAALQGRDKVVDIIDLVKGSYPEIDVISGRTIAGTTYKVTLSNNNPLGGFRAVNEGVVPGANELTELLVSTYRYENPITADVALAEANEDGVEAYLRMRSKSHVAGGMELLGGKVYYGSAAEGSKEFPGMAAYVDDAVIQGYDMAVNAGGSTANKASSVFLAYLDVEDGAGFLYGMGQGLNVGAFSKHPLPIVKDGVSTLLEMYYASLGLWIGFQRHDPRSIVRIANLTTQADKGLTDALISEAISRMPAKFRQDKSKLRLFANNRSMKQLQDARTAINQVAFNAGAIADWPTEAHGVSIVETDSIVSTEAIRVFA